MPTVRDTIKKNIVAVSTVIVFLLGGTITAIVGGFERIADIIDSPNRVVILERRVDSLEEMIHKLKHSDEMFFHTFRYMTDNDNPHEYAVEAKGYDFPEVDIRNTNERLELAFIYEMWRIYPLDYDDADSLNLTVKLHDYDDHETKATKLILVKER